MMPYVLALILVSPLMVLTPNPEGHWSRDINNDGLTSEWTMAADYNDGSLVTGNYTHDIALQLEDGSYYVSEETGTFVAYDSGLSFTAQRSTCENPTTVEFSVDYTMTGTDSLRLRDFSYERAIDGAHARATYGCFSSEKFTPRPLLPVR